MYLRGCSSALDMPLTCVPYLFDGATISGYLYNIAKNFEGSIYRDRHVYIARCTSSVHECTYIVQYMCSSMKQDFESGIEFIGISWQKHVITVSREADSRTVARNVT